MQSKVSRVILFLLLLITMALTYRLSCTSINGRLGLPPARYNESFSGLMVRMAAPAIKSWAETVKCAINNSNKSAVLFFICGIIITKKISKDDSAITILAYQSIFMSLLSFIIVLFFWEMPSLKTFIYLILSAICGTVLHLTLNHAFKLVDVSMTQPYSFLNLVFASIIGYFVFDEIPDAYTWIGASIIFIGVLIISYREMKLDKEIIRKRVDIKS